MVKIISSDDVSTVDSNIIYHSESYDNDTFFTNDSIIDGENLAISENLFLKNPNKTLHVFHNMRSDKVYVTYENNLKTPVEFNGELHGPEGIYILDRHMIPFVLGTDVNGLTKYYSGNVELEGVVKEDAKEIVKYGINSKTKVDIMRFLTFIPKEDFNNCSVFSSEHRMLVSLNNTTDTYPVMDDYNLNENNINILISNSKSPDKKYYLNIFGVIRKMSSVKLDKKDGVYINYLHNKIRHEIYCTLEEIESVGLYDTREKAMAHGDIGGFMELQKMKHQLESMKIESVSRLISLKETILKSNMAIEEKRLNIEILEERIKLEKVKGDAIRAKATVDLESSRVKSTNNKIDFFTTVLKLGSKLI